MKKLRKIEYYTSDKYAPPKQVLWIVEMIIELQ